MHTHVCHFYNVGDNPLGSDKKDLLAPYPGPGTGKNFPNNTTSIIKTADPCLMRKTCINTKPMTV